VIGRSIDSRLARLGAALESVAAGSLGERIDVRRDDALGAVEQAFNRSAAALEHRLAKLEHERRRAREATARFAEVLAATHDVEQLLRVVVETAVEATGADGGVVIGPEGELVRTGDPELGARLLELPLLAGDESFGSVVLSGESFDDGRRETAVSLVSHAVVALENARLHTIVEQQALLDGLTGLPNRRALEQRLRTELTRTQRLGGGLCLVFADLDRFKAVNDRHGHPFGDVVLREFGRVLEETTREIDLAGRWGGEEFALILPEADVLDGAALAERARRRFAARDIRTPEGAGLALTASFGVAASPPAGDLESLVVAADEALYRAKRSGRDRVERALQVLSR